MVSSCSRPARPPLRCGRVCRIFFAPLRVSSVWARVLVGANSPQFVAGGDGLAKP